MTTLTPPAVESMGDHEEKSHLAEEAPRLSPDNRAALAAAKQAHKPITNATRFATFSAYTLAIFATLSLPFALFSLKGLFIAAGLTACAFCEFRGRKALLRLVPDAPRRLARNQAVLTVVMLAYCAWSAHTAWFGQNPYAPIIADNPELGPMLEPFTEGIRQVTVIAYGIVASVGLVFQAFVIRYYDSRKRYLKTYLQQTPEWVVELHRL